MMTTRAANDPVVLASFQRRCPEVSQDRRCTISAAWLLSINPRSTFGRAWTDRLSVAHRRAAAAAAAAIAGVDAVGGDVSCHR